MSRQCLKIIIVKVTGSKWLPYVSMNIELHRLELFEELCQHYLRNVENIPLKFLIGDLGKEVLQSFSFEVSMKHLPCPPLFLGNRPALMEFSGQQGIAHHRVYSCSSVDLVLSSWRRRKHSAHKGAHLDIMHKSLLMESLKKKEIIPISRHLLSMVFFFLYPSVFKHHTSWDRRCIGHSSHLKSNYMRKVGNSQRAFAMHKMVVMLLILRSYLCIEIQKYWSMNTFSGKMMSSIKSLFDGLPGGKLKKTARCMTLRLKKKIQYSLYCMQSEA